MTEYERKQMMLIADSIKGEINRMCVTDDLSELINMEIYAIRNIERLYSIRKKVIAERTGTYENNRKGKA